MNIIAAVDNNWGIGYQGNLLFSIPEDMQYFKKHTETKVVIMGHCTLKSLPNTKPLKNRTNIILSHDIDLKIDNAIVFNSVEQLLLFITNNFITEDVFVIGGQTVYKQLIDYCHVAYITKINAQGNADRYFPKIESMDDWEIIYQSEEKCSNDIAYKFTKYINKNPKCIQSSDMVNK